MGLWEQEVFNVSSKEDGVDDVTDPKIQHKKDVILYVASTLVAGSDLHIYNGLTDKGPHFDFGEFKSAACEESNVC